MPLSEIVGQCTEALELAARLAVSEAGSARVGVGVELRASVGARLAGVSGQHTLSVDRNLFAGTYERNELAARAQDLALDAARHLLLRFDWVPRVEMLRPIQTKLTG